MLSFTIEERLGNLGNSVKQGILVNPGSQEGAMGGTEGPVDGYTGPCVCYDPGIQGVASVQTTVSCIRYQWNRYVLYSVWSA